MPFRNQNIAFHQAAGSAADYRFFESAAILVDVNDGPDIDDAAWMSDTKQIVLPGVGIQQVENHRIRNHGGTDRGNSAADRKGAMQRSHGHDPPYKVDILCRYDLPTR